MIFGTRVIAGRKKGDHINGVLSDLRWLFVSALHIWHAFCIINHHSEPLCICRLQGTGADTWHAADRHVRKATKAGPTAINIKLGKWRMSGTLLPPMPRDAGLQPHQSLPVNRNSYRNRSLSDKSLHLSLTYAQKGEILIVNCIVCSIVNWIEPWKPVKSGGWLYLREKKI